ncbi:hypothetical protein QFC21_003569 [Naganishia friedmannii]|uniref:Uncharacterized protein n=1 Tax=Naganishia friedmannii TaxID=89922 RepID=A0ACC2VPG2_9TREE|nr:hypothetical protein QFC21_003569 [Naganishia friedmannii]
MSHIDTSVDRLTTFPSAFPDEVERGQVNQVISSLFNKVRSRFGPSTSNGNTEDTSEAASRGDGGPGRAGQEDHLGVTGSSPASGAARGQNGKRQTAGPTPAPFNLARGSSLAVATANSVRSTPSNPTSPTNKSFFRPNHSEPHSLLGLGLQGIDATLLPAKASSTVGEDGRNDPPSRPISIQTRESTLNRPPLARNVSSRAPAPAPPLVSTTPVIRTHDYALVHQLHRQPQPPLNGRHTPDGYPIPGMSPSRRSGHQDLQHSYHRKNASLSSVNRFRKSSLTGSVLTLSPSSTSLSMMNNGDDRWDYSAVPGFSIADDVRSIRTIDIPTGSTPGYNVPATNGTNSREYERRNNATNPSVTKIIRRLRGEGLSKNYWMADENCKECYDCKSVFTTWRRKHHCRICGQIFCSRCAPNIIKGHRFGHDGMVRVCNLCLAIMDEYDDDDDNRSVGSAATSSFPHSVNPFLKDSADSPRTSQSPFAASQLFGFARPSNGLAAISEQQPQSHTRWRSDSSDRESDRDATRRQVIEGLNSPFLGSPPGSPEFRGREARRQFRDAEPDDASHALLSNMSPRATSRAPGDGAPFRRAIQEEDNDVVEGSAHGAAVDDADAHSVNFLTVNDKADAAAAVLNSESAMYAVQSPRQKRASVLPEDQSKPTTELPFIAFPTTENGNKDDPASMARLLSPVAESRKQAKPSIPPGLLRSRLSSRMSTSGLSSVLLSEITGPHGMWRSRADSFIPSDNTLQGASLGHFRKMLKQAIERESLPRPKEWATVLESLLLKVCASISPNVRAGDSLDARTYVKIKKIPGGKISQSEYVDGIVITKNVAHKQMPRHMISPRIMILTFALDYHRVDNQLVSLEPLMAQEKNYLKHLTKRVTDLRPHVVLVEKTVSRLALDFLLEAKVAVARGVKPSAIQQVARYTQADIIASMDRLALEPKLGRCAELRIQTFEHPLIPGNRKTYMRFEGCHEEFGCSLIVRGSDLPTLVKVKAITDFMVLVVMNLKMEMAVYYDEHNILPPDANQQATELDTDPVDKSLAKNSVGRNSTFGKTRQEQLHTAERQTAEIEASLAPYVKTALSTSTSVHYPPPAPLAKMGDLDRKLRQLLNERDEEEAAQILREESRGKSSVTTPTQERDDGYLSDGAVASVVDSVTTPTAKGAQQSGTDITSNIDSAENKDVSSVLVLPSEIRLESEIAQISFQHAEQLKVWAWYLKSNPPDIRPQLYQGLTYLNATVCEGSDKPCTGPELKTHNFYSEDDCTLGQYLEALAMEAGQHCANKTCARIKLHHFQVLVHGKTRLQIAVDQFLCPSPGNESNIITWSYCKVCKEASPTAIIKEETWKFSWAKYLEHSFYPPRTRGGFGCSHDIYQDQIRYFALHNVAIRIHNEAATVYDVMMPSLKLQTRQETRVLLKNAEYEVVAGKLNMDSLRAKLNALADKANENRQSLISHMNATYKLSPMTDVLALNAVYQVLQEKAVAWETEFHELEKIYLPSEKDIRRMTATHLKRLFASQDSLTSTDRIVSGQTITEDATDKTKASTDEKGSSLSAVEESKESMDAKSPTSERATSDIPQLLLDTPMPKSNPLDNPDLNLVSCPPNPPIKEGADERLYDSDSTISALPLVNKQKALYTQSRMAGESSASGIETDARVPPSRLPRRTKPTPTVADLVKRFQMSSVLDLEEEPQDAIEVMTPPPSEPKWEESDSENESNPRPRLRRGKTEGHTHKPRHTVRHNTLSDGDRSYAANASRIPTISAIRRPSRPVRTDVNQASLPPYAEVMRDSLSHASRLPPSLQHMASRPSSASGHVRRQKSEISSIGKGKAPVRGAPDQDTATVLSTAQKSSKHPGTRVSTIARHFDRLTREAERDRQKRMNQARGRRARPVGMTNAKIQVFNNVRDAFRDESDSASSEADDEDDDENGNEASGSEKEEAGHRPSSLAKPIPAKPDGRSHSVLATRIDEVVSPASTFPEDAIISTSSGKQIATEAVPSMVQSSISNSDAPTDVSFKDRLKITLPPFDTSTPLLSVPPTPLLTGIVESKPATNHVSLVSESEGGSIGHERSSILKTLSNLWAFRTGEGTPLEYPLSVSEHIFADSRIIIREDEPTSIIAFTLASRPYTDKLRSLTHQGRTARKQDALIDEAKGEKSDMPEPQPEDAVDLDDTARREGGTHLNYEQFATLRAACNCEDSFLDSLARCLKWDSSGGKSGSAFLKTRDDRFIAKEVSRLEMDALTKFAPSYFEYMKQGTANKRPTALAKIYGFFKIGYKNATTGRVMRMNVLLMENLFYERRFERIYDLKGSMRNRLVQATGKENQVLLDENLMEIANRQPLYLRDHDKKILKAALWNDTLFLANLNVMDYSLVVGVDSESKELVVGVVDYIRTFTWDKKLESWVKDLGAAGRGEPTIVTPKQYKVRFRAAMDKYFPSVPDRWSTFDAPLGNQEDATQTL